MLQITPFEISTYSFNELEELIGYSTWGIQQHVYLQLKKNMLCLLSKLPSVWTQFGEIKTEWRRGKATSHITNQSSTVRLINAGESHNAFSPAFAPSSLASWFSPSLNAHLPLSILQMLMFFTILSWALFVFSQDLTYSPWIFASGSTGLNYHALYAYVSPIFNSKQELPPKLHPIKFNCLLDSSPWIFHKYLELNISKTQPIVFTTKSAFLLLSTMLLKWETSQCNELHTV